MVSTTQRLVLKAGKKIHAPVTVRVRCIEKDYSLSFMSSSELFRSRSISHSGQSGLGSRADRDFAEGGWVVESSEAANREGIMVFDDFAFLPGLKGSSTASFSLRTFRLPSPGHCKSCSGVACTIFENDPKFDRSVMTSVLFIPLIEVRAARITDA